jgi:putative ABC transport system permease protein
MGLLGLILFAVEKRAKEISIRKVLGAGVREIVFLLIKDFALLMIAALFIASPAAWYFMSEWLKNFSYRINIGVWVFVFAGATAFAIALATISFHVIKAALVNPIKFLRSE